MTQGRSWGQESPSHRPSRSLPSFCCTKDKLTTSPSCRALWQMTERTLNMDPCTPGSHLEVTLDWENLELKKCMGIQE